MIVASKPILRDVIIDDQYALDVLINLARKVSTFVEIAEICFCEIISCHLFIYAYLKTVVL